MSKETLSTSEKEVPKIRNALTEKYRSEEKEPLNPENIKKQSSQLPEPSGWRLLVLPFTPKEKTKGGILIAQESLEKLRIATNCGYVLKMGPLAYQDKEKYQYMLGQVRTYQYMLQEISNLLKDKELKENEGNVIDLGKRTPKT